MVFNGAVLCVLTANTSDVDTSALDELQEVIDDAEHRLLVENIDSRYAELESTAGEIDKWLDNYAAQLVGIHLDVDNIRQINATLPRECFKKIDLEPVEPEPSVYL